MKSLNDCLKAATKVGCKVFFESVIATIAHPDLADSTPVEELKGSLEKNGWRVKSQSKSDVWVKRPTSLAVKFAQAAVELDDIEVQNLPKSMRKYVEPLRLDLTREDS
jgi:hypothetical protein